MGQRAFTGTHGILAPGRFGNDNASCYAVQSCWRAAGRYTVMATDVQAERQSIALPGQQEELTVYVARPEDDRAYPAVLLIHEAFGLDEHIAEVTRRLAAEGFVVVAPDLFSLDSFGRTVTPAEMMEGMRLRMALPPERRMDPAAMAEALAQLPEAQGTRLRQVLAWSAQRDNAALVPPLQELVAWARARSDTTAAVGVTGFCFGGGMTLRLAFAGAAIDAAAPFYGQNPPLEQAGQVRCPLLLMYGRNDPFIMPGLPALLGALHGAERSYELHVYEQAGHAFLNDTRPDMYGRVAAEDAWHQLTRFFGQHLQAR
ncbi:MAG TPA: dienelactone hydrolase family protein [Chloroflexota bacterium]